MIHNGRKRISRIIVLLLLPVILCNTAKGEKELNVALLGDSMTWIGGDNFEKPNGWTHYAVGLPLHMKMYARSGATWTNTHDTKGDVNSYSEVTDPENVIYNQAMRLIGDKSFIPDLIIIYAGTNDAWFASKRPGIFNRLGESDMIIDPESAPSGFTSLEGSIRLVVATLNRYLPNARIYLVTPAHSGKIPEERIEKVSDIIEKAGRDMGVAVVRGDREFGFSHNVEISKPFRDTYDGVHSNEKGARKIAEVMRRNIFLPELVFITGQK